jgi:Flp pilus assembly protein TadG
MMGGGPAAIAARAPREDADADGREELLADGDGTGNGNGDGDGDAGIATIEVVILAPLLILFVLVLVGLGQMVDARSSLDGAARDAARAGSLQGDLGTAKSQARSAVTDDLSGICVSGSVRVTYQGTDWTPQQGVFAVQVTCRVRGLVSVGFGPKTTMKGTFSSPLDPYRRLTGG